MKWLLRKYYINKLNRMDVKLGSVNEYISYMDSVGHSCGDAVDYRRNLLIKMSLIVQKINRIDYG